MNLYLVIGEVNTTYTKSYVRVKVLASTEQEVKEILKTRGYVIEIDGIYLVASNVTNGVVDYVKTPKDF